MSETMDSKNDEKDQLDNNVNSVSAEKAVISDSDSDGTKSPETRCSVCLGRIENKSFSNTCFHTFCYICILEWSKVKAVCPLCKQPFTCIIHNVRSNDDYDQHFVKQSRPTTFSNTYFPEAGNGNNISYRFLDGWGELRRAQAHAEGLRLRAEELRRQQEERLQQQRALREQVMRLRCRWTDETDEMRWNSILSRLPTQLTSTSAFRKRIYNAGLWVQGLQSAFGGASFCSDIRPSFLKENPACCHRLIPWLNRELNALLSSSTGRVSASDIGEKLDKIIDLIKRYDIASDQFYRHVHPFFARHTRHFVHEFHNFARSTCDMESYDRHAIYGQPRESIVDTIISDVSSDDEVDVDVGIVASSGLASRSNILTASSARSRGRQLLRSPSPVAGPSGMAPSSLPNRILPDSNDDSDVDAVAVVGFDKPWTSRSPILLSSDEDVIACDRSSSPAFVAEETQDIKNVNKKREAKTRDSVTSSKLSSAISWAPIRRNTSSLLILDEPQEDKAKYSSREDEHRSVSRHSLHFIWHEERRSHYRERNQRSDKKHKKTNIFDRQMNRSRSRSSGSRSRSCERTMHKKLRKKSEWEDCRSRSRSGSRGKLGRQVSRSRSRSRRKLGRQVSRSRSRSGSRRKLGRQVSRSRSRSGSRRKLGWQVSRSRSRSGSRRKLGRQVSRSRSMSRNRRKLGQEISRSDCHNREQYCSGTKKKYVHKFTDKVSRSPKNSKYRKYGKRSNRSGSDTNESFSRRSSSSESRHRYRAKLKERRKGKSSSAKDTSSNLSAASTSRSSTLGLWKEELSPYLEEKKGRVNKQLKSVIGKSFSKLSESGSCSTQNDSREEPGKRASNWKSEGGQVDESSVKKNRDRELEVKKSSKIELQNNPSFSSSSLAKESMTNGSIIPSDIATHSSYKKIDITDIASSENIASKNIATHSSSYKNNDIIDIASSENIATLPSSSKIIDIIDIASSENDEANVAQSQKRKKNKRSKTERRSRRYSDSDDCHSRTDKNSASASGSHNNQNSSRRIESIFVESVINLDRLTGFKKHSSGHKNRHVQEICRVIDSYLQSDVNE